MIRHEASRPQRPALRRLRPRRGRPRTGDPATRPSQDRRLPAAVDGLLAAETPFLAVCLGHQVLCDRLGIPLAYKDIVFQGTQSTVRIDGRQEPVGFYNTFVGRDDDAGLPDGVSVEADPATGDIHLVAGPTYRGVQFHAESILTENGFALLRQLLLDLLGSREGPGRRPPRLLHLEPRPSRRGGHRRPPRRRRARQPGVLARAPRPPTWCSRQDRATRPSSPTSPSAARSSSSAGRCSASALACRPSSRRTAARSSGSSRRTARWRW